MGKIFIATKKSNFLSFRSNLNLIFFTNNQIKKKKGIKIPICFTRKVNGKII